MDGVTKLVFLFFFFHGDYFFNGALDRIESRQSLVNSGRNRVVSTELEYKSLHKTILQSAAIAFHLKWTGVKFFDLQVSDT